VLGRPARYQAPTTTSRPGGDCAIDMPGGSAVSAVTVYGAAPPVILIAAQL